MGREKPDDLDFAICELKILQQTKRKEANCSLQLKSLMHTSQKTDMQNNSACDTSGVLLDFENWNL